MTSESGQKEIYFHVGLGKTATTYLQYKLFPRLKGIHYIQRTRYPKAHEIIAGTSYDKYLISREFDQQLQVEIEQFAKYYPDTRAIVVFRRHDSWIASQYRRFAKNGIHIPFQEFFDIEHDQGAWKQGDLNYMNKIRIIENTFGHKPLVLFHDELKHDPYAFFDKIAAFTGATYDRDDISLNAVHKSYEEKQLKAVRKVSKIFFPANPKQYNNAFMRRLQWRKQQLTSYAIMGAALLIPDAWLGDEELIPSEQVEKIRDFYADDWAQVQAYAEENAPARHAPKAVVG